MVKTWKTRKQGLERKQEYGKTDGGLNRTNWQQTNREHRYKYTGDNGADG
jgi:hypothetical protein